MPSMDRAREVGKDTKQTDPMRGEAMEDEDPMAEQPEMKAELTEIVQFLL